MGSPVLATLGVWLCLGDSVGHTGPFDPGCPSSLALGPLCWPPGCVSEPLALCCPRSPHCAVLSVLPVWGCRDCQVSCGPRRQTHRPVSCTEMKAQAPIFLLTNLSSGPATPKAASQGSGQDLLLLWQQRQQNAQGDWWGDQWGQRPKADRQTEPSASISFSGGISSPESTAETLPVLPGHTQSQHLDLTAQPRS